MISLFLVLLYILRISLASVAASLSADYALAFFKCFNHGPAEGSFAYVVEMLDVIP